MAMHVFAVLSWARGHNFGRKEPVKASEDSKEYDKMVGEGDPREKAKGIRTIKTI